MPEEMLHSNPKEDRKDDCQQVSHLGGRENADSCSAVARAFRL